MKINKYWHKTESNYPDYKGKNLHLVAWGGSLISEDDAREQSKSRLEKILKVFIHEYNENLPVLI